MDIKNILSTIDGLAGDNESIFLYDTVDLELSEDFVIETGVVGFTDDGIILEADDETMEFLELNNIITEEINIIETEDAQKPDLYTPYEDDLADIMRLTENPNPGDFNQAVASPMGSINKNDEERVADDNVTGKDPEVVSEADDEEVNEAEYQGRKVTLNKPMQGDVKKSKVYVKNAKGNVVKVNFGQKGMNIKKNNPGSRKSFRARHNCSNPGPKWKARYWSCRAWQPLKGQIEIDRVCVQHINISMSNVRYEVITQENNDGDLILPIPPPMLKSLGWKEGEELEIGIDGEGQLYIKKADSI